MNLFDIIDALPDWVFWLLVIGVLTVISAAALGGSNWWKRRNKGR
ncbi:hypothetical protein LCGC14_0275700 [marine sediment metagenome]|uniref:Uncharacterized protein n=1 Tax=marine sediment metagenome TaxID=412755 RepID=A0A0F9U2K3_9ZZZZ